MAAYPNYTIGVGSDQELESGWQDTISAAGTLSSRQFHASQYYRFTLIHPALTIAQWQALRDTTYAADPRATHTLTYHAESPAATYSVQFIEPPQIVANHGGSRYDVQVKLRGTKD